MPWTQHYSPLGNIGLSALLAAMPVVLLLALLGVFHVKAHWAAIAGLGASVFIAAFVYRMPGKLTGMAALDGAAYGLFPIGWIVLCAIFVYDITVYTGQFEVLKHSVAGIAGDRRTQALLIAFSFGAFIEGAAGFGTPVAISAAMLIGLGFKPRLAAGLALIGNTAPVAFGALGTPIIALAKVTGIPAEHLSAMVGRQLPLFSLIVPFWLIWAMCGWRRMLEVWPACLVAGGSFAVVQFAFSNYVGPTLVDIAASTLSIVSLMLLLTVWRPQTAWEFPDAEGEEKGTFPGGTGLPPVRADVSICNTASSSFSHGSHGRDAHATAASLSPHSTDAVGVIEPASRARPHRAALVAWMPWVILSVLVFAWGLPPVKAQLDRISAPIVTVPLLHQQVLRAPPVVSGLKPEDAKFLFNWLSATGTALLLSGIISGFFLGLHPLRLARLFGRTLWRVRISLLTIAAMMALGFVTRYGGLDATMGLAFAKTGKFFPFFSPLLGWLGVALTGSDTASNVLFGNLQQISAQQVGVSPLLAAASNSSGGVMGKMIDAQSIVVAGVATNQQGQEGSILRYVFFHSLALAVLVGLLVMLQAYVFPAVIP